MRLFGWPRLLAFCGWVALLVTTYAALSEVIGADSARLFGLKVLPLLMAVLVGLPNVMLFVMARMVLFRFARRSFQIECRSEADDESPPSATTTAQIATTWAYERSLAEARYRTGLLPQAAVWGLLTSGTLSFCVLGIHMPPEQLFPNLEVTPTWHIWVAWTVLATATTSLLLIIGRLLVRIANNDATPRTLATAGRSFALCVVSAGLLACLTLSSSDGDSAQTSIAMGIAVGLLGDRAFLAVSNRAAALLGAEAEIVENGNELRTLEGLSSDEAWRLHEENIGSIHALAFVPPPRLFFNSSQPLRRICDWQDQALLIVLVGAPRARTLRELLQVRGAIDAHRLAGDPALLSPELTQQMVAALGLPGEAHLHQLLQRIAKETRVEELRAYRSAALRLDADDAPRTFG